MDWWVFARSMRMDGRVVVRAMMMLEFEELENKNSVGCRGTSKHLKYNFMSVLFSLFALQGLFTR
jgi:hypothetical protein